jgi:hypothetical protein
LSDWLSVCSVIRDSLWKTDKDNSQPCPILFSSKKK